MLTSLGAYIKDESVDIEDSSSLLGSSSSSHIRDAAAGVIISSFLAGCRAARKTAVYAAPGVVPVVVDILLVRARESFTRAGKKINTRAKENLAARAQIGLYPLLRRRLSPAGLSLATHLVATETLPQSWGRSGAGEGARGTHRRAWHARTHTHTLTADRAPKKSTGEGRRRATPRGRALVVAPTTSLGRRGWGLAARSGARLRSIRTAARS